MTVVVVTEADCEREGGSGVSTNCNIREFAIM